jgi:hypothetical protein
LTNTLLASSVRQPGHRGIVVTFDQRGCPCWARRLKEQELSWGRRQQRLSKVGVSGTTTGGIRDVANTWLIWLIQVMVKEQRKKSEVTILELELRKERSTRVCGEQCGVFEATRHRHRDGLTNLSHSLILKGTKRHISTPSMPLRRSLKLSWQEPLWHAEKASWIGGSRHENPLQNCRISVYVRHWQSY